MGQKKTRYHQRGTFYLNVLPIRCTAGQTPNYLTNICPCYCPGTYPLPLLEPQISVPFFSLGWHVSLECPNHPWVSYSYRPPHIYIIKFVLFPFMCLISIYQPKNQEGVEKKLFFPTVGVVGRIPCWLDTTRSRAAAAGRSWRL